MSDPLRITIAGEPVAQGRPRFSRFSFGKAVAVPRTFDDPKSEAWKRAAARVMRDAIGETTRTLPAFPEGAVELEVYAVFRCPKNAERKRTPTPARWKESKPDPDNVAKAVMDAGTGVLWTDDAQVARLIVSKVVGAQGDDPRVEVIVRQLPALW